MQYKILTEVRACHFVTACYFVTDCHFGGFFWDENEHPSPDCIHFYAAAEYEIQFLDHTIPQYLANTNYLDHGNGPGKTDHQNIFWNPL